jgi:MoaA/NifB/PqqE/SkfB family radical SAM enzyme
MKPCSIQLQVDDRGRLVMPPQVTERFGLVPGAAVRAVDRGDTLAIDRSIDSLARIYVEPTTRCNMQCRTCMRNVWDEPPGAISSETLSRVLDAARRVAPHPTLFFGGLGEPFAHPEMLAMLAAAKSVGGPVEVITNGTLLDDVTCRELVRLEVERLWVSIDGATAESYADVRLWDALPQVIADLARLRELRRQSRSGLPRLGIAFVAMKRNLADLPEVIRLGQRLGADRFSVTNVLAHTDGSSPSTWCNRRLHASTLISWR